jgi:hypothetical protein
MTRINFQDRYKKVFARLGHRLAPRDSIPAARIFAAEKKLDLRLPMSLRDYYLVAGGERSFNHAYNRLCAPGDLAVHSGKLVFMEENQCVVVWGVTTSSPAANDPVVFQGPVVDGEPNGWYSECSKCSAFLVFMLHLQGTFGGGMSFHASAPAPASLVKSLDRNWQFAGEVNKMRAYGREGQAVCFLKWQDLFEKSETWRVFAGAGTKVELDAIASDLHLKWD